MAAIDLLDPVIATTGTKEDITSFEEWCEGAFRGGETVDPERLNRILYRIESKLNEALTKINSEHP